MGIEFYLRKRGLFGVTRTIFRRLVALASAWAAARVGWITRLPLRFRIAPVVSWATPNLSLTFTTFAMIASNGFNILYNSGQIKSK